MWKLQSFDGTVKIFNERFILRKWLVTRAIFVVTCEKNLKKLSDSRKMYHFSSLNFPTRLCDFVMMYKLSRVVTINTTFGQDGERSDRHAQIHRDRGIVDVYCNHLWSYSYVSATGWSYRLALGLVCRFEEDFWWLLTRRWTVSVHKPRSITYVDISSLTALDWLYITNKKKQFKFYHTKCFSSLSVKEIRRVC